MFKVALGRPGGAGAGMSRETGRARRAAANKLDMSHFPPSPPLTPALSPSLSLSARASSTLGLNDAIFSCISQQRVSCKC